MLIQGTKIQRQPVELEVEPLDMVEALITELVFKGWKPLSHTGGYPIVAWDTKAFELMDGHVTTRVQVSMTEPSCKPLPEDFCWFVEPVRPATEQDQEMILALKVLHKACQAKRA